MNTLHIIIKGNVQGVGFRATVEHYANKMRIKGSVRNLANGSVEIYAQGTEESLEPFVESLKKGTGLAIIEHVAIEEYQVQKQYDSFQIIF